MAGNPRSTASIAGHPLHPMVVIFPIAFFVSAFVCDLVFWRVGGETWATRALWLIGIGLIMAGVAAVLGLIDFLGDRRIRALNDARWHAGANVLMVLIQLYSWYARYTGGSEVVVPTGLVLSLVAVGLLGFSGWLGGELVFRAHVGVEETPPAAASGQQPAGPRHA